MNTTTAQAQRGARAFATESRALAAAAAHPYGARLTVPGTISHDGASHDAYIPRAILRAAAIDAQQATARAYAYTRNEYAALCGDCGAEVPAT